jgi:methionyl-tRNA synthetase
LDGSTSDALAAGFLPLSEDIRRTAGDCQISAAMTQLSDFAVKANVAIEAEAPWKLAKSEKAGDGAAGRRLDATLYSLSEVLRVLAILLSPVLPKAAHGIFDQLNWKTELSGKEERFRLADVAWGLMPDGHQLGAPTPLFPRIETPVE